MPRALPACLPAASPGGPEVIYNGSQLRWPNGRYSMCGNRFDDPKKRWMRPTMASPGELPGSSGRAEGPCTSWQCARQLTGRALLRPAPAAAKYVAGQAIELQVLIASNHYGRHQFSICPADAQTVDLCMPLFRCAPLLQLVAAAQWLCGGLGRRPVHGPTLRVRMDCQG